MNVYVIVRKDQEYPMYIDRIWGVFATREGAQTEADKLNAEQGFTWFDVQEWNVTP